MPGAAVAEFLARRLDADLLAVVHWRQPTTAAILEVWPEQSARTMPNLALIAPPADNETWQMQVDATQLPAAIRAWLPKPLGRTVQVSFRGPDGARYGVLAAWQSALAGPEDVADALASQQAAVAMYAAQTVRLLHAERRLRLHDAFLAYLPVGIVCLPLDGSTGEVNAIAAQLLGVDVGMVAGSVVAEALRRLLRAQQDADRIEAEVRALSADPHWQRDGWAWRCQGHDWHVSAGVGVHEGLAVRVWRFERA